MMPPFSTTDSAPRKTSVQRGKACATALGGITAIGMSEEADGRVGGNAAEGESAT